jgi:hypothetical protein
MLQTVWYMVLGFHGGDCRFFFMPVVVLYVAGCACAWYVALLACKTSNLDQSDWLALLSYA